MARRAGRAPGPVASSSSSTTKKPRPQQSKGPKSIHDVYDYAVNQEQDTANGKKKKGKADRSIARAKLTDVDDNQHTQRRHKRQNRDDDAEGGEDDSEIESDDTDAGRRKAGPSFLDGSDDDDQDAVASEDDSDIDSDDAFGDSEDEMGLGRNKHNTRSNKYQDSDSERSAADDFEDDQGSDIVDLSRMLDDDNEQQGGMDISSGDDDDDDDDSDDNESESDSDTQSRLARLAQSYAQASSKRQQDSQDEDEDPQTTKRQRRLLSARTEAMPELEYAATSSGSRRGGNIAIDDLLGSLGDGANAGDMSALRASTKALRQRSAGGDAKQPVASRSGGGALSAPLADVVKDKLQRSAGYDLSKEEADKWQSTIKRLREAEHLSFPLQAGPSRPKASTARMTASFKPSNALESDIDSILQAEGLSEKQIAKHEELAMRKLDPEEAQRRREELRAMRELTFRAEQKAKRANKIKSKTYRKIARKDKEKQRQKMIDAGLLPADSDDEDQEGISADRAKAERLRAKERATLKHKNTGKWAQQALGKRDAFQDEDTRNAINEQLQRSDQLRRRIAGHGDGDSSSSDDDDSEGGGDALKSAFDEIRALDSEEGEDEEPADNTGQKGVWNMKFMKDARHRDEAANRQSRRELEEELRQIGNDGSEGSSESDSDDGVQQHNVGRRIFGNVSQDNGVPKKVPFGSQESKQAVAAADEDSDEQEDQEEESAVQSNTRSNGLSAPTEDNDPSANPWLSSSTDRKKASSSLRSTSAAGKSNAKLDKHKSKTAGARAEAEDDARVEIDPQAMLARRDRPNGVQMQPSPAPAKVNNKKAAQPVEDEDSDDSSSDEDEPTPSNATRRKANTQRDLIAEAFAGDDLTSDFAAAKAREIAADTPQEVDDSLPGWGSWGGKGAKRSKPKTSRVKLTTGLDPSKRKDARLSNVIISEKRDKKLDKYRAKELPYPYTSAAQYQASLQQPIGPEWNTTTQNQRLQMPRVLQAKPGSVIKPVQRVG